MLVIIFCEPPLTYRSHPIHDAKPTNTEARHMMIDTFTKSSDMARLHLGAIPHSSCSAVTGPPTTLKRFFTRRTSFASGLIVRSSMASGPRCGRQLVLHQAGRMANILHVERPARTILAVPGRASRHINKFREHTSLLGSMFTAIAP